MKFTSGRAERRIAIVRRRIKRLGYRMLPHMCMLTGFDSVESWAFRGTMIYLGIKSDGEWNIIAPVCETPKTEDVFEVLEHFTADA